jgi:hypothetical protein
MSTPTERDVAEALKAVPPILPGAGPRVLSEEAPPEPDEEEWRLAPDDEGKPVGVAWVFYGEGHRGLVSPVIIADGFNSGPSTLKFSWDFLEGTKETDFRFISALRARKKDVIILGFTERSASILKNSEAAIAAIEKAIALRDSNDSNDPLVVGGLSMGGLVTRYALAKMEHDGKRHETGVYFSYDSPHRGAYIPISLQAFAHFPPIRDENPTFSDYINSDAAQELLRWHISTSDVDETPPGVSEKRTAFLKALEDVGEWPKEIPRLLAVANGVGTGVGNGIDAGKTAIRGKGGLFDALTGTDLRTMPAAPDDLAAKLQVVFDKQEVKVSGLPAVDGAPGGTLDSFKILADALNTPPPPPKPHATKVDKFIDEHCFVPAVSAVDVRDLDTNDDLYTAIEPSEKSGLTEYQLATEENEEHTKITDELCTWLLDRF